MHDIERLIRGGKIALPSDVTIRLRRTYITGFLALSFAIPAFGAGSKLPAKVDKALAGELKRGAATHKVIITFDPGQRTAGKQVLLQRRGNRIQREHASLNMLVGE